MKLFISYAHKDRDLVKRLHYLLENVSKPRNDVFYDRRLTGGDKWWSEILGEIEKCDVFVFALSPESNVSLACQAELQYAIDLNKPILPVKIQEAKLPTDSKIQDIHYIDGRDLDGAEIALAISRSLGGIQNQLNRPDNSYKVPDPKPERPEFPDPLKVSRAVLNDEGRIYSVSEKIAAVIELKQLALANRKLLEEANDLLKEVEANDHQPRAVSDEARSARETLEVPIVQVEDEPELSANNSELTTHQGGNGILKLASAGLVAVVLIVVVLLLPGDPDSSAEKETQTAIAAISTVTEESPTSTPNDEPTITPTTAPSATPPPPGTTIGGGTGEIAWHSNRDGDWDIYMMNLNLSPEDREAELVNLTDNADRDYWPVFSPDGRYMAFLSDRSGSMDLWIMNLEQRGTPTRITDSGGLWGSPFWMPNGNQIIYSARAGSTYQMFRISIDGTDIEQLTSNDENSFNPSVSPDGTTIVFQYEEDEDSYNLYLMDINGENRRLLWNDDCNNFDPSWMSDVEVIFTVNCNDDKGSKLWKIDTALAEPTPELYTIDDFGEGQASISPDDEYVALSRGGDIAVGSDSSSAEIVSFEGTNWHPEWRPALTDQLMAINLPLARTMTTIPEGGIGEIVYQSRADDEDDWELYMLDTADLDAEPQQLTDNIHYDGFPAFSPDGSRLAFMSERAGGRYIWIMNLDDPDNPTRITDFDSWSSIAWTPNGQQIVFGGWDGEQYQIYRINVDGTDLIQLTTEGGGNPSISPDGSTIVFNRSPSDGEKEWDSALYLMDIDGANQRRLLQNDCHNTRARWGSSAEQRIIYQEYCFDGDRLTRLYLLNVDTNSELVLVTSQLLTDTDPSFTPDGQYAVFRRSESLFIQDLTEPNAEPLRLTRGQDDANPTVRPNSQ